MSRRSHFVDVLQAYDDPIHTVADLSGRDLGRIVTVVDGEGETIRGELVDVKHRLGLRSVIGINTGKTWSWRDFATDKRIHFEKEG